MLALQFLLGMSLNLIGSHAAGSAHELYIVILAAHIINAIGLLEGAIFIAFKASGRLAWWAAVAISITFIAGVLTVATKADAWSFVMACGFLVSSWLYVTLYVLYDRQLQD